jgi:hypothetical protein
MLSRHGSVWTGRVNREQVGTAAGYVTAIAINA